MNKSELISAMAAESGLTKADSKKALEAFMASITKALKAGDKVSLVGFGTFAVSERAARLGSSLQREQHVRALILLPNRVLRFLQRKLLSLNLVWS